MRFINKKVSLREEEQAIVQPPPTSETQRRKDGQLKDVIEMTIFLKALGIHL
jgi:hypothetical protein